MNHSKEDKELLERFWAEFDAYTLGQYITFKSHYAEYIEPSILRGVHKL